LSHFTAQIGKNGLVTLTTLTATSPFAVATFSTLATLSTIWRQQQQIGKFGKEYPFSICTVSTDSTDLRGNLLHNRQHPAHKNVALRTVFLPLPVPPLPPQTKWRIFANSLSSPIQF
jgi:hypothetical protein